MKSTAALLGVGMLLIACANRPESIPASYVSHEKFSEFDCAELAVKMSGTQANGAARQTG